MQALRQLLEMEKKRKLEPQTPFTGLMLYVRCPQSQARLWTSALEEQGLVRGTLNGYPLTVLDMCEDLDGSDAGSGSDSDDSDTAPFEQPLEAERKKKKPGATATQAMDLD